MAITIQQYPTRAPQLDWVHQSTYPEYYTCTSTNSSYSDFRYLFKFYTEDGLVSNSKNPPYITDELGVYDATPVLQEYLYYEVDPEIVTYYAPPGAIQNYLIKATEFSDSIGSPSTSNFQKTIALNCHQEDWDYTQYRLDGNTKKFLSKLDTDQTLELGLNEPATLRCLAGMLRPNYTSERSLLYEFIVTVTDAVDGYIRYYIFNTANPYYAETTANGPSTSNTTIEDLSHWVLEIPVGPKNINQMTWRYVGINSGGTYWNLGNSNLVSGNIVDVDDTYYVEGYTWPTGGDGRTSQKYYYKVVDYCSNQDPILLCWENELGGTDYFSFTQVNAKNQGIERSVFRQVRDSIGVNRDNWMGHNDYDRGLTNYYNNITTTYFLNSDWLENPEWTYLEDLWLSKNVFAMIDDTWYPVVLSVDNMLIETTAKGLRQYSFEIILSNKRYV